MANNDEGRPESTTFVLQSSEAIWTMIMPMMASERAISSPTIREGLFTPDFSFATTEREVFFGKKYSL